MLVLLLVLVLVLLLVLVLRSGCCLTPVRIPRRKLCGRLTCLANDGVGGRPSSSGWGIAAWFRRTQWFWGRVVALGLVCWFVYLGATNGAKRAVSNAWRRYASSSNLRKSRGMLVGG